MLGIGSDYALTYVCPRRDELTLTECLDMFAQVARGVQTLHKSGVLWLDGKPSNCLVDITQLGRSREFNVLVRTDATHPHFSS